MKRIDEIQREERERTTRAIDELAWSEDAKDHVRAVFVSIQTAANQYVQAAEEVVSLSVFLKALELMDQELRSVYTRLQEEGLLPDGWWNDRN